MFKSTKSFFFIALADFIVVYFLFRFSNFLVAPHAEPVVKYIITSVPYIVIIYGMNQYETESIKKDQLFSISLIIIFLSIIVSTILSYLIFFSPLGRKVYLIHSILFFIYFSLRNKAISKITPEKTDAAYIINKEIIPFIKKHLPKTQFIYTNVSNFKKYTDKKFPIIWDAGSDNCLFYKLMELKLRGYQIFTVSNFVEHRCKYLPVDILETQSFFEAGFFNKANTKIYSFVKRSVDIIISTFFLIILSPFLLFISLLIRIDSKGPVFYKQTRTGFYDSEFTLYKFRSMVVNAEKDGIKWAEKNDSRITGVGKYLRKYRLDELPQLINILNGSMSLVGPRPERPEIDEYLRKEIKYYPMRYMVKPGLTGWAQISYDYSSSIEDSKYKLMYDLYYIKHVSLLMDIDIMLKTLRTVIFGKGR
ncbi:MAG: sugar transferase [Flexistipes sinusarabici]|uniref:Sugar transferase n=1 Tax=Flexistipes sinusarabici TaxID=2352 RepID=A0A5D0MIM8_FLESI|nr:sugar transferase [Flexistipes sinusarabici]TYB33574.1 MAG: sugar transferase [Flexistipes sinusarabici]